MLTISEKEAIRCISLFEYTHLEKNGKPITYDGKEFLVPSLEQIRTAICEKILKIGFSTVEKVEPHKANCIIRVFQKHHYHHGDWVYNVYGAICYTLKSKCWTTTQGIINYPINHSECIIQHWLCQDEYVNFNMDFFDFYMRID